MTKITHMKDVQMDDLEWVTNLSDDALMLLHHRMRNVVTRRNLSGNIRFKKDAGTKQTVYECHSCGKQFETVDKAIAHRRDDHEDSCNRG